MSTLSRSLTDVPEESGSSSAHPDNSPYLNPIATSSTSTLTTPSLSSLSSRASASTTRTPSIRTLGRSSNDYLTVPSSSGARRSHSSSSSISISLPSKGRKPFLPAVSSSAPRYKRTPTLPHDKYAEAIPSTVMYWSRAPVYGTIPQRTMRAHTMTLVENIAWLFGGNDEKDIHSKKDLKDMYCFDIETMQWTIRETTGDIPPTCRAHTATVVDKKLVVIGGGHGMQYYDRVYVFDTLTWNWTQPAIYGPSPTPRRAHSAVLYQQKIWIFGGGTGLNALNDVWTLDVSSLSRMKWEEVKTTGRAPRNRGYHTANLVGNLMVVIGGSDGKDFFTDVWFLNLDTGLWSEIEQTEAEYKRIAHSATQVGSFLYITGGFDGQEYCSDVLPFNLISLTYEPRLTYGRPPSGRGYHSAILADSRLFVFGGFDGSTSYDDVYILDLAAGAYLPQVTSFNIELED